MTKIETYKAKADEPKHTLMEIADDLEKIGASRQAKELSKIIARLELWMSKK